MRYKAGALRHCRSALPSRSASSASARPLRRAASHARFLLLTALGQFGCDGWTWEAEASKPPVDGARLGLKLLGVRDCTPTKRPASPSDTGRELRLLGVEVEITSFEPSGLPFNDYYASLEDSSGRRHRSRDGCEPLLSGPPLAYGDKRRGFVSFAVPTTEKGHKFVYAPRLPDDSPHGRQARVEVAIDDP